MKKIQILGAAFLAAVLSMGFASCGDDEMDAPINNETVKELDKEIKNMPLGNLDVVQDADNLSKIELKNAPFSKLLLLDNGKILGEFTQDAAEARETRAAGAGDKYVEGSYTVNADGSITATLAGKEIKVSMIDSTVAIEGEIVEAVINMLKPSNNNASLCRTWYPAEYTIIAYAGSKAIGSYSSKKLVDLQKEASKELGTTVNVIKSEIEKVVFLTDGTIITNYGGTDYQVANWKWEEESAGILSFDLSEVDKNLMNIPAFTRFKKGTPNTCQIVSAFNVEAEGKNNEKFDVDLKLIISLKDAK